MGADLPLSQCATNEPEMARRSERRSKLPPLSKIIPDAGCPAHQVNGGDIGGEHLQSDHRRSEEHTSELQSLRHLVCRLVFSNDTATTEIYTLSLHDALPI